MKSFRQSGILILSVISLGLAGTLLTLGILNHQMETRLAGRQAELNRLQAEINRGITSQRLAQNILQDMASMANGKPDVQKVLSRYLTKPNP